MANGGPAHDGGRSRDGSAVSAAPVSKEASILRAGPSARAASGGRAGVASPISEDTDAGEAVRLVPSLPKTVSGCEGSCSLPKIARQTFADLADFVISPMVPGPLYVAGMLEPSASSKTTGRSTAAETHSTRDPRGGLGDDAGRLDRLWELRMCVEHLGEVLDAYDVNLERDELSTAEEILGVVEDTLRRVAMLGVSPSGGEQSGKGGPNPEGVREAAPIRGTNEPVANGSKLLQAIGSLSGKRGALTERLLASRLHVSGLLEAALGELTDWKSTPSEVDLRSWRRWDRIYERLARRASRPSWEDQLLEGVCCEGSDCPCHCTDCMEQMDSIAPMCTPLCRLGRM